MEVAGVVIGGVGLAALFDSCMNTLEYVDVGRKYGSDYQKDALKISVLELRLARWKQRVSFSEKALAGFTTATTEQSSLVKSLLEQIQEDLESAEKTAKRYALPNHGEGSANLERLGAKFRELSLKRQKKTSIAMKTSWALRDKRRLDGLIVDITTSINSLEDVFPALGQPSPQKRKAVIEDVEELVQPAEVEEPDEASEPVIPVLQEITDGIDVQLHEAVDVAASQVARGDTYINIFTSNEARLHLGNYIASGYVGPLLSSDRHVRHANNVKTYDKARVHIGESFGGKHVFDD